MSQKLCIKDRIQQRRTSLRGIHSSRAKRRRGEEAARRRSGRLLFCARGHMGFEGRRMLALFRLPLHVGQRCLPREAMSLLWPAGSQVLPLLGRSVIARRVPSQTQAVKMSSGGGGTLVSARATAKPGAPIFSISIRVHLFFIRRGSNPRALRPEGGGGGGGGEGRGL